MPDQRPPRFVGDERETLMALWRYHRESFARKVSGISDDDAARRFVTSDTTLLWLTNHVAGSQRNWIVNRFAGRGDAPLAPSPTMAKAIDAMEQTWQAIDPIIESSGLDDLARETVHGDPDPLKLRWIVAHLLEETARHAGHADILRELIDGSTGR
jgi:hypothetical protein